MNIAIVGIGGIGGHIAGLLCNKYEQNCDINIFLIARGEHLKAIQKSGVTLYVEQKCIKGYPTAAEKSGVTFPKMDYIFYSTKSYDIENSVELLKPMLKEDTYIIPILNGVDGAEKMKKLLPSANICEGLAFIVSYIKEAGVIENSSKVATYFFGDGSSGNPKLKEIEAICKDANIDITYSSDIKQKVWEKYCFISTVASMTTAYNINYGTILNDDSLTLEIKKMILEFEKVAIAKGGFLPDSDRQERIIRLMQSVPALSTTSMQRDFWSGKRCEVESLTHYIIKEAEKLGIPTPTYSKIYRCISKQIQVTL